MATTDEAELDNLARAAQRGNQRAFGELVERLMNPVMALTYRLTGDRDTASDLAQETFVTAWKEISQYRGQGPIKNWVWRIASNRSLNYLESRARRQKLEAVAAPDEVSTHDAPDRNFEQSELQRGVLEFMSTLPPQQRVAFDLRFYQQLSFEEMSEIMGRALGTVKTLYREAVGKLRLHAQRSGWRS
jgi:RNA polymerase sigma factor (sigma-70 family)